MASSQPGRAGWEPQADRDSDGWGGLFRHIPCSFPPALPGLESSFLCGRIRDIQLGTGYAVWERCWVSHGPVACGPRSGNVPKGGRQGWGRGTPLALLLTRTPRRALTAACPDPHQDTSGPVPVGPLPSGRPVGTATEKGSAGWQMGDQKGAGGGLQAVGLWAGGSDAQVMASPLLSCGSQAGRPACLVSPSERGEECRRPPRVVGRSHKPAVWALHVRNVLFHVR